MAKLLLAAPIPITSGAGNTVTSPTFAPLSPGGVLVPSGLLLEQASHVFVRLTALLHPPVNGTLEVMLTLMREDASTEPLVVTTLRASADAVARWGMFKSPPTEITAALRRMEQVAFQLFGRVSSGSGDIQMPTLLLVQGA